MNLAYAFGSLLPAVDRATELVKLADSAAMIVFTAIRAKPCLKPDEDTHASHSFAARPDHDRDDFPDECGGQQDPQFQ